MTNKSTLRELYPHMPSEQFYAAEDRLEQYLVLILRIYNRITSEPESYAQFRLLTEKPGDVSSPVPVPQPASNSSTNI